MSPSEYPIYDFLTASKVERALSVALKIWMNKFAEMFVDRWREFAPTDISVAPMLINSLTFEAAQNRWQRPSIGVPITIRENSVHGMIVVSRIDLLILMMEILSETLAEQPPDRELTSIEMSLSQLFFQHSIATFGEAWPEKELLPISMDELDLQPNRCRLFSPLRQVLVTGFEIRTTGGVEAGPARVEWVFAHDELKQLLGVPAVPPITNAGKKIPFENLSSIGVEVSATLGSAELEMNELLQLATGDIVKLNQSIERPLTLLVNDRPTFQVWPGRCGNQQCFQVESTIEG